MISIFVPVRTISEANATGEHWSKKSKRHNLQHRFINLYCKKIITAVKLPCTAKLIRIAPRKLDDDNLRTSLKYIRDALANLIIPGLPKGHADDSPLITWQYDQQKGEPKQYGVKIEFTFEKNTLYLQEPFK